MTTISLSDIQKNIWILSNIKKPIKIRDKRKDIDIVIVYPISKWKKSSILDIAWSLNIDKDILDKSENMDFKDIKKQAQDTHMKSRLQNFKIKK